MTHDTLRQAAEVLGLGDRATLAEIKARYRALVKLHDPDAGGRKGRDEIYRVIEAYGVIIKDVESYRYCFSEQEYMEQDPEERVRRRFMGDPLWSMR